MQWRITPSANPPAVELEQFAPDYELSIECTVTVTCGSHIVVATEEKKDADKKAEK
jgi:hypothetical protein